jgi:hypothetical protein
VPDLRLKTGRQEYLKKVSETYSKKDLRKAGFGGIPDIDNTF